VLQGTVETWRQVVFSRCDIIGDLHQKPALTSEISSQIDVELSKAASALVALAEGQSGR
jgi:hypothetical protein